jgi:hypothetical protein
MANSAATKKPFKNTRKSTRINFNIILITSSKSFSPY